MQSEVDEVARKVVVGMRQLAEESIAIDAGTHSDRIRGYAAELADAIGYVEPSADLLVARRLAANALRVAAALMGERPKIAILYTMSGQMLFSGSPDAMARTIKDGEADQSVNIAGRLEAVTAGRRLAEQDEQARRHVEMMKATREQRAVPDRLTITIDGPQGSGKTQWTRHLLAHLPLWDALPNARIVEMQDGRPFDARNEVFLDHAEG